MNVGENYQQYISTQEQYYGYAFQNIFVFDHFGWELHDYLINFVMTKFLIKQKLLPVTDLVRDKKRNHKFLCLNGGGRQHRKILIDRIKKT